MTSILSELSKQAARKSPRILVPEHCDERVLTAAANAADDGIASPVVLDSPESLGQLCRDYGVEPTLFETINRETVGSYETYVRTYAELRGITEATASTMLESNLVFGMLLLRLGEIDGVVAGALHPTAEVIAAANSIVGLDPTIETASSFFLMITDTPEIGENGALVYSDCGVNIDPGSDELADIALTTAMTTRRLLDWEPRIAMLSFSTKGSASHQTVEKVREATTWVQNQNEDLLIDGEMQSDAALVPAVAKRKIGEDGAIQGDANILIFPDLESGNIAYKLTERLAGAKALGPILQGYARPLSDLSRGANVEDIYDIILVTVARAAKWEDSPTGNVVSSGLLRHRETELQPLHPPTSTE